MTPSTGVTSTLSPGPRRPDIELVPSGGQQAIKGVAQVRAWMEPDAFESQVIEPLDFDVVENKVLIHSRAKIRGAGSGIELESLSWAVWTLDEAGLIARIEVYLDHQKAEALEAVGLPPQGGENPDPRA